MASNINELKKQVFYELLKLAGRVFLLVNYSEDVIIGSRGFLPEEKEKGLVLVFNDKMQFEWTGTGISARLVFGSKTETCILPSDSILSVFSPELSAHFSVSQLNQPPSQKRSERNQKAEKTKQDPTHSRGKKVVKVDFGKKK